VYITNASLTIYRAVDRGGFRHVSTFGRTGGPTKRGPHRPEIVGRHHDIFWPVACEGATYVNQSTRLHDTLTKATRCLINTKN